MAFHPYPQLIPAFCNRPGFGPPRACSARLNLVMGGSPGFGSIPDDSRGRVPPPPTPFRTRLRSGSACSRLSLAARDHSSAHSTKGTPSRTRVRSDRPEAQGFRLCFTPLAGVLFTVPSRYWFPIGRPECLALGGGPPRFPPDSACRAVLTQPVHARLGPVAYGALTRSGDPFQRSSAGAKILICARRPCRGAQPVRPTPGQHRQQAVPPPGFGLPPVRSPLLGGSSLFLGVLRCFSSPGAPQPKLVPPHHGERVAPFGDPRIAGRQRLPGVFRRVAASFLGSGRLGIHPALFSTDPAPHARPVRGGARRARRALPALLTA